MRSLGVLQVILQLRLLLLDDRFHLGLVLLRSGSFLCIRLLCCGLLCGGFLLLLRRDDAHMVHQRSDLVLDVGFHLLEHVERLDLVLDERVALTVSAQVDAVAQHVHVVEVLHPLLVDDAQHDDLLELAHVLLAKEQLAVVVALLGELLEAFLELVAAHRGELFLLEAALRRVDLLRVLDEPIELPLLRVELRVRVLVHLRADDVLDHAHDVLAQVLAEEDLAALAVHDLALLVHDVIVLEDVLADVEVARLDLLLRVLDRVRDELVLDRFILVHAELVHDARDAVRGEEPQQVILERQVEARSARITLTAGTAAQLVVDAA